MSEDWYKALARKYMASQVLLRNAQSEILIVKPNYKDHWLLPGGMIEENESPLVSAKREVKEELGIELRTDSLNFVCVDYRPSVNDRGDSLLFMFDGGELSDQEIASIDLQDEELDDFSFVQPDEIGRYLNTKIGKRLKNYLATRNNYLEDGTVVQ